MARSKSTKPRQIEPDPKYQSRTVARLINRVMVSGKKSIARAHVYQALDILQKDLKLDPLEILDSALAAITPQMEVRSRRVGGAAYQVPMPVKTRRASSLAIRWLVGEAGKRPGKDYHTFSAKLVAEIKDPLGGEGGAIHKKTTSHKMADANKAFAHFRW